MHICRKVEDTDFKCRRHKKKRMEVRNVNKKKITILVCTLFMVMSLGACGKAKEDKFTVTQQESESVDSEINNDENIE